MSVLTNALERDELVAASIECIFDRYLLTFDPRFKDEVRLSFKERQFVGRCVEQYANYCKALNAHERQEVIYVDSSFGEITLGDLYNWLDGDAVERGSEIYKKILVEFTADMPADVGALRICDLKHVFDALREK